MKFRISRPVTLALLFSFAASAFEYPIAPERDYFSGAKWRERDQVVVPAEGLELKKDTILKVDELLLKGPLYSNGNSLKIDALQITFEPGGAIKGYKGPAPKGEDRDTGPTGKRATNTHGTGGNGITPDEADPGVDGRQSPMAIVIFAARMSGDVVIDGTGQKGGQGGKGGKGGKGGTGGPGKQAKVGCWDWVTGDGGDATPGGPGGQGAPGGKGGKGGRGGAPIPLVIVSGAAVAQNASIISKVGERGEPGVAGEPGDRGEGGPGGPGASKGCFLWTNSRPGAGPGPKGPVQTATLGPGEPGDPGPAVDLKIAPMPLFKDLQVSPGVVRSDLSELETKRAQLVDAWAQFHWARTFLFLTLDTLTEVDRRDENRAPISLGEFSADQSAAGGLLDQILAEADDERLKTLMELWSANLIVPFQGGAQKKDQALLGAEQVAIDVVRLLDSMVKSKTPSAELREKLERVRSGAFAQLQASLDSALDSCRLYIETKGFQLEKLLNLTSQYGVPVCEGKPDFRLSENVDKPITLFHTTNIYVDDELKTYHQRVSRLMPLWGTAFAEGFVGAPGGNKDATAEDVQRRLPDRGVWQVPTLGVFMGFPAIKRAGTPADIRQELFYLQQNLIRIRNR